VSPGDETHRDHTSNQKDDRQPKEDDPKDQGRQRATRDDG